MLVVDPEKRFTVDQCLAHPWMTASTPGVNDSTDGLVGGIAGLGMDRRGVMRERTLLASINEVQVSRVAGAHGEDSVKVFSKNPNMNPKSAPAKKEMRPDELRNPEEFVAAGGKGDQELFGNDGASHYSKADVVPPSPPKENGARSSKGKGKGKKH